MSNPITAPGSVETRGTTDVPPSLPALPPDPALPAQVDLAALGPIGPLVGLVQQGVSIDAVKEAFALYREERAYRARQEYLVAYAAFQGAKPSIRKNRDARRSTDAGTPKLYSYADLDQIAEAIREPLAAHGLSYSWTKPLFADKDVTISCRVAHVGGHVEETPVTMPVIAGTSLMNEAQKRGAVLTYAMRYSLIAALALTSCEDDTDARVPEQVPTITEGQAADLALACDNGGIDRAKFLGWLGAKDFSEIRATDWDRANAGIAKKRKGGAA